ncbi:MAG: NAD(P)H-hydrate dehydratase [Bacteroidota bacterium]|nr:NAD(P)H-hydrate dehydratase [Bacteroidota bacterium]
MKILSADQIRRADAYTIKNEPVSSINLMERASLSIVRKYTHRFENKRPVIIFCGTGNNGGDGLAIGRLLIQKKYHVRVFVIGDMKGSKDFQINYDRLSKISSIEVIKENQNIPHIQKDTIVFDAIFGSGLSRGIEGIYAEVIQAINKSGAYKIISVDIASGLFADKPSKSKNIIEPQITLSFQTPKLSFLLPENEDYVGDYEILDINLSKEFLDKVEAPYVFLTAPFIANFFKSRKKYAHKGDFGKALIIAGSKGKMGAAILSCKACLRTGVGLLTAHTPSNCWPIMQMAVHEAMVQIDKHEDYFSGAEHTEGYDVIGIGPGLGMEQGTIQGLTNLLNVFRKPLVFDADAINIIGQNQDLLSKIPENSIFTPHPKEFERLVGPSSNHFERLEMQKEFSQKYKLIVLLKGAHTSIAAPDGKVYFNATGNSGMATGGSGDILTGMITSLLAQKYKPLEATLIGAYIHGLAGDFAAEKLGKESMLPTDIVEHIGDAYQYLHALKN